VEIIERTGHPSSLFITETKDLSNETVEKQASERLMENVHPASFAAGRNPEE
jgi:hypothetical protein